MRRASADFAGVADDERDRVMDDYMEILAQLHGLAVEPFAAAGITPGVRPGVAGRIGMSFYERAYRATKRRPDPFLEFCLGVARPASGRRAGP